jgi:hypothetical protein
VLRKKLGRLSTKLLTAELRSDQNLKNVPLGIGAEELDAIRSNIARAHMLFKRDLVSDDFNDAVVFGDLLGVGHAGILVPLILPFYENLVSDIMPRYERLQLGKRSRRTLLSDLWDLRHRC